MEEILAKIKHICNRELLVYDGEPSVGLGYREILRILKSEEERLNEIQSQDNTQATTPTETVS